MKDSIDGQLSRWNRSAEKKFLKDGSIENFSINEKLAIAYYAGIEMILKFNPSTGRVDLRTRQEVSIRVENGVIKLGVNKPPEKPKPTKEQKDNLLSFKRTKR